jgi:hypothetical protein
MHLGIMPSCAWGVGTESNAPVKMQTWVHVLSLLPSWVCACLIPKLGPHPSYCPDDSGHPVASQLVRVSPATQALQYAALHAAALPDLLAAAVHEVAFIADLPPLGCAPETSPRARRSVWCTTQPFRVAAARGCADGRVLEPSACALPVCRCRPMKLILLERSFS